MLAARKHVIRKSSIRADENIVFNRYSIPQLNTAFNRHAIADAHIVFDKDVIANVAIFADDRFGQDVRKSPDTRPRTDRFCFDQGMRMSEIICLRTHLFIACGPVSSLAGNHKTRPSFCILESAPDVFAQ